MELLITMKTFLEMLMKDLNLSTFWFKKNAKRNKIRSKMWVFW